MLRESDSWQSFTVLVWIRSPSVMCGSLFRSVTASAENAFSRSRFASPIISVLKTAMRHLHPYWKVVLFLLELLSQEPSPGFLSQISLICCWLVLSLQGEKDLQLILANSSQYLPARHFAAMFSGKHLNPVLRHLM